jgi:hypothetical protein
VKRRTVNRTALAGVAVLAVTGVIGCAQERRPPATPITLASAPAPERLTPEVARRAFRAYTVNEDVARASGDERLALSWAGDGQSQLIAAAFRKAAFTGEPVPRYGYGEPRLYVPRLDRYPQWFVAVTDRTTGSGPGGPADGRRPAAGTGPENTAIMAFLRTSPADRWRLSLATLLNKKAKIPQVTVDQEGYATPLATFDGGLVIQPRGVPAIQATLAGEGSGSVAVSVMRKGPYTTGYYGEARKEKKRAEEAGLAYDTVFTASGFPIFPLRTADGGGLVLYALSRNTVTFLKNSRKGHLAIPRDAAHLLDTLVLRDEINVTETLQFSATVPAQTTGEKSPPKAEVIAHDGAVTRAVTRKSA